MAKCVVFSAFLCVQLAFCQLDETCQTVDNEIGSCISVRSCEPYLRLVQDSGSNRDDVFTLLKRAKCGFEGNDIKVCCPRPGFPSKPATTSTTTTPQPETPPPRKVAEPAYPVRGKTGRAPDSVVGGQPAPFEKTCQTVDNEIGSCISIRSCEPYLRLAQDSGSNPDAVQLLRRAHCGFEGNNPKVCCPRPGFPSKPAITSTTTTPQPETPRPREVAEPAYPVRGKTGRAPDSVVGGQPAPFDETCQTVDNEIGSCISIVGCEPYLRLAQESRSNPDAVQKLRRAHCGLEGYDNPKVCCPRPGFPSKPATTSTTTTPQPETPPPREVAASGYLDSFPAYPVCGKLGAPLDRVVNGSPARLGAFPWMALLGYKIRGGRGALWNCGGSLVSSRHVLTAAHCIHFYENSLFLVRLGELDLATESDGATPVDVLIENMIEHEEYNHEMHTNDIGLLWLDKDVQFTSLIQPICLPQANNLRSMILDKYWPLVAGWGSIKHHGPKATHLQVTQLPVVSNSQCANAYSMYTDVTIDQRIVCAGYLQGGKDACEGDSGGPLMLPVYLNETVIKVALYQIGVVSSGRGCAEAGFPGIYTRVTYFMPWLQEKMLGIAPQ